MEYMNRIDAATSGMKGVSLLHVGFQADAGSAVPERCSFRWIYATLGRYIQRAVRNAITTFS